MTPRLTRNLLHAFLFTAVSLSLSLPLAARSTLRQTGEQRPVRRHIRKPGGVKRILEALFLSCDDANVKKRRELLAYGPQFPDRYDESDFHFYALVDTNWPMAVVYELEQQATAVVTIEVKDAAPFTQTLAGGGMGREQTERFTLPVYKGKGPHPARISLKATRDGSNGKERAEFRFVGAGAGEGALASAPKGASGLEVAALGPLPLGGGRAARDPAGLCQGRDLNLCDVTFRREQGAFAYSFKVASKFNKWGAYIKTYILIGRRKEPRTIREVNLEEEPIGPNWSPISGVWDGLNKRKRKVGRGDYWVMVKVWRSADSIAAWAVEKSKPYFIN